MQVIFLTYSSINVFLLTYSSINAGILAYLFLPQCRYSCLPILPSMKVFMLTYSFVNLDVHEHVFFHQIPVSRTQSIPIILLLKGMGSFTRHMITQRFLSQNKGSCLAQNKKKYSQYPSHEYSLNSILV